MLNNHLHKAYILNHPNSNHRNNLNKFQKMNKLNSYWLLIYKENMNHYSDNNLINNWHKMRQMNKQHKMIENNEYTHN
jgi:hypothetical protein